MRLHGVQLDLAKVTSTFAQEKADSAIALATAEKKARDSESKMNLSATQVRRETNAKVQSVVVQRDALIDRVRIAEANAVRGLLVPSTSSNSRDGKAPRGAAGTELLGSIGVEDVEEANRADTLRLNLQACYAQYDAIRKALNQ